MRLHGRLQVVIDGTDRSSTQLSPGLYSLYAEGASCYVEDKTTDVSPSITTATANYIPAGGTIFREVVNSDPEPFLWVKQAPNADGELSEGILRINKHE